MPRDVWTIQRTQSCICFSRHYINIYRTVSLVYLIDVYLHKLEILLSSQIIQWNKNFLFGRCVICPTTVGNLNYPTPAQDILLFDSLNLRVNVIFSS